MPPATQFAGICFVTTAFAPIIEFLPIRTFGKTVTLSPSQTPSSIITGPSEYKGLNFGESNNEL